MTLFTLTQAGIIRNSKQFNLSLTVHDISPLDQTARLLFDRQTIAKHVKTHNTQATNGTK